MNVHLCKNSLWIVVFATAAVVGCGSNADVSRSDAGSTNGKATAGLESTTDKKAAPEDDASQIPFVLGDMIEPFTPPTLAELNASTEWVDRPVQDGAQELRKRQAEKPPTLTAEQALALRNDSPRNTQSNQQILETLGQLAPESGSGVNFEENWIRHVSGDLKSSNPLLMSSITEFEYQALTGFGFVTSDKWLNYFAPKDTVVSWQTSKNYLVDKFVLRDDLTWSDGKPITAHDVKFSFQVIMSKAVIIPAVRQGVDQLRWVEAYDDHTLVFFHKEPLATNTTNLSVPVIPKHVYEKSIAEDPTMGRSREHSRLEDAPVVGGPYELVGRSRNQEFVLRRRDGYFTHNGQQVRRKPYFREIRVKVIEDYTTALLAAKAGEIEEMMLRPEQWESQTNDSDFYQRNTKVTEVEWTEFHFCWNLSRPFFADKRVRQAMSYAFDYNELLKVICRGLYQPCQGPYHPTSWAFPKNGPAPYRQDLNKAEDLLDQAGWKDSDGDGIRDKLIDGKRVPFEFVLLTFQSDTGIQTATLMKECLSQIGIICHVKPTEFTVLTDSALHHEFDATMGGWGSGSDPDSSANIFVTNEGRNYGVYSNPRIDELFHNGRRELDREKRAAIYGEIHQLLWEDQPYTWLFYRNAFYAFSKKLRGYNFAPTGPYNFDPGISGIYKPIARP